MVHRSERRRHYLEGNSFAQQSSENEHKQLRQPFTRQKRRNLQGSDYQTCVKKSEGEACLAMAMTNICANSLEQQILEHAGSSTGASIELDRRLPAGFAYWGRNARESNIYNWAYSFCDWSLYAPLSAVSSFDGVEDRQWTVAEDDGHWEWACK
jgi:hypothetical protein